MTRNGTPVHVSPLVTMGGHDGHRASDRDGVGPARGVGESSQAAVGPLAGALSQNLVLRPLTRKPRGTMAVVRARDADEVAARYGSRRAGTTISADRFAQDMARHGSGSRIDRAARFPLFGVRPAHCTLFLGVKCNTGDTFCWTWSASCCTGSL